MTNRRVDLEAFGETNEEVFAKLLMTPPTMETAAATIQMAYRRASDFTVALASSQRRSW